MHYWDGYTYGELFEEFISIPLLLIFILLDEKKKKLEANYFPEPPICLFIIDISSLVPQSVLNNKDEIQPPRPLYSLLVWNVLWKDHIFIIKHSLCRERVGWQLIGWKKNSTNSVKGPMVGSRVPLFGTILNHREKSLTTCEDSLWRKQFFPV